MDLATMKKGIEKSGKGEGEEEREDPSRDYQAKKSLFSPPTISISDARLFAWFFRFLALGGTKKLTGERPRFLFSVERLRAVARF